jgi:nudix-type nucleoside diphosphatase (YffH/AdpP family)
MPARIMELKIIYEGWGKFLKAKIELANGEIIEREIEDHGRTVAVLPYDPERRIVVLVRQMRPPLLVAGGDTLILEAPAGRLDGSNPEICARREAREEAGLRLEVLEPVGRAWTTPGVSTEQIDLFLARFSEIDRVTAGGGLVEEQEYLEVVEVACAELASMMDSGYLLDLKTLTLALALRLRHPYLFDG